MRNKNARTITSETVACIRQKWETMNKDLKSRSRVRALSPEGCIALINLVMKGNELLGKTLDLIHSFGD